MKRLLICVALALPGCMVLKGPEPVEPTPCPVIELPPPVPEQLELAIEDGHVIEHDDGGEQLLRSYVAVRDAIRGMFRRVRTAPDS